MDPHGKIRIRSFLMHQRIADRLEEHPELLQVAQTNLERWRASLGVRSWMQEWKQIIDAGVPDVLKVLRDPGEYGDRLRSSSPFPGVLSQEERRHILSTTHHQ